MAKHNRDLAQPGDQPRHRRGGQATRSAGPVTLARAGTVLHRVVPAHLACRIGARAQAGTATPGPRWSPSRWGRSRWCSQR